MTTATIFCANDQRETPHSLEVEPINGEIVATCDCGRFLKFAPSAFKDKQEFAKVLDAHKAANEGQVSLEQSEKLLSTLGDEKPSEDKA